MKKYSPYILPAAVLIVVLLLVFRWYSNRTQPVSQGELFGEGVQIEDLTDQEAREVMTGSNPDIKTVQLVGDSESTGMVRYDLEEDKVRFSVIANLPESSTPYNVWLKEVDGEAMRNAFSLEMGKGGYVGSAALPANLLPFEVIVSTQANQEQVLDNVIMKGVIDAQ